MATRSQFDAHQHELEGYISQLCPTLTRMEGDSAYTFVNYYDPRFMLPPGCHTWGNPYLNMYKVPTCAVKPGSTDNKDFEDVQVKTYSPLVISVLRQCDIQDGRTRVGWQTHGLVHLGIDDIRAGIDGGGNPQKEFALIETLAAVLDTPARTSKLEAHELVRVVASTSSPKHEQRFAALFAATLIKDGSMPEWFLQHQHMIRS